MPTSSVGVHMCQLLVDIIAIIGEMRCGTTLFTAVFLSSCQSCRQGARAGQGASSAGAVASRR